MMNIFLDKSLPKRTRIALQVVRVVLLTIIFGSFFYAAYNPAAADILLYSGVFIGMVFIGIKVMTERKRKNSRSKNRNNDVDITKLN